MTMLYMYDNPKGRYALPVHTARTYGPCLRPVCTGAFLTPVCTARTYGPVPLSKNAPVHTALHTGCMHGPYVRVVRIGF